MRIRTMLALIAVVIPAQLGAHATGAEDHCRMKIYSRPPNVTVPGGPTVGPAAATTGMARCTTGVDLVPAPLYPGAVVAFAQLDGVGDGGNPIQGVFTGPKVGGTTHVAFNKSGPDKYQTSTVPLDPTSPGDLTAIAHHPAGDISATYMGTP